MRELLEKGILLSFDELRVLLYACGVRAVEGVFMPEKAFSEEDVISILYRLTKRGLISAEEEVFVIREDLKELLDMMGAPERTFIHSAEDGREYFCYESADRLVISELYRKKADTVKLTASSPEAFRSWREERRNDHDRGEGSHDGEIL